MRCSQAPHPLDEGHIQSKTHTIPGTKDWLITIYTCEKEKKMRKHERIMSVKVLSHERGRNTELERQRSVESHPHTDWTTNGSLYSMSI